jgi:nitrogenase molybdenum-iron protein alpha/beta subunit
MLFREPLHGCAFTGALSTLTQIRGAVTVAHGPRSCSHIAARTILSSGIHAYTRKGLVLPRQMAPAVLSSDMDEGVVIYGGGERLRRTLREAMAAGPEAVFVVTACPSGVIGDDPAAAVREIRSDFPDTPVLVISTDGNIRGDYMQGVINACLEGAAALIDPAVTPRGRRVNILAEKNIANNAAANYAAISDLLGALGVAVNCRFVRDVDVASLRGFKGAALNLLAYDDHFGRVLRRYFQDHHGAVFAAHPFPVGFTETERWLGEIGSFFGRQAAARELAAAHRGRYDAAIQRFHRHLEGKRLMIVSYIHDVDWILETAFDLGMIVEKVGILNYSQDHLFRTRFQGRFALETDYGPKKRDADLSRIRPDLMLCNYVPKQLPVAQHVDSIPLCPDVGFYGGLAYARRWAALLKAPIREGWRDDGGR